MTLKSMLTGIWFTRLVLVSCIICSVSTYFVFKNMEFIVHGQLYDFGLIFSPEWADGYRVFTWLVFLFAGVSAVLSGIALTSSFLNVVEMHKKENAVPQRVDQSKGITKVRSIGSQQSRPVQHSPKVGQSLKETGRRVNIGKSNCVGISCPECKKVFGRALVMLDFRGNSNRLVSVCPYCNHVLGFTDGEERKESDFMVVSEDEKVTQ